MNFLDTTIAELIKEETDSCCFLESLQLEQEFMNGIDTDKVHPILEDMIAQKMPLIKVFTINLFFIIKITYLFNKI